jgi:AraC family transcriptional regulator
MINGRSNQNRRKEMAEHFGEIELVSLPAFRAARYQVISQTPEDDSSRRLGEWLKEQKLQNWESRRFGFDVPAAEELQKKGLRGYESWVTVPQGVEGSADVDVIDFPGGRYAYMLISDAFADPFQIIPAGWQKLVNWVKDSAYQFDDRPCLEEVIETSPKPALAIYLAIK